MHKDKINFDQALLEETLSIQSKSNKDEEMLRYIKQRVEEFGCNYSTDTYGNIYVTKGVTELYSCIVAHTDTVHDIREDFSVFQNEEVLFAFSDDTESQVGIGGDDKVGIFIALNLLRDSINLKAVFFRNEEIGCLGSKEADMSFFSNCNVVLQADRRGNSDFINVAAGTTLCSKEFLDTISQSLIDYGYKIANGSITDVMTLKRNGLAICCANVSCGYHHPHSDSEIVRIDEVEDCLLLFSDIIDKCAGKKYVHLAVKPMTSSITPMWDYPAPSKTKIEKEYQPTLFHDVLDSSSRIITTNSQEIIEREDWMEDDEDMHSEDYLEELDIMISDIESVLRDYAEFRQRWKEKKGRL